MDKFYEQFITKDYGIAPKIMRLLFYITLFFVAISISLFIFFGTIAIFIGFASAILCILSEVLSRKLFLEYEYEYFEGEITVSKIINKKSRKIIATFNLEQISKVSKPNNSQNYNNVTTACIKNIPGNTEIILFISGSNQPKGYYLSIDEKFLDILKKQKPSMFNYI